MMYYLYKLPLIFPDQEFFKALNVFQYITLRALGAAVTAFLISLMCGNWVIRRLISLKLGQPIRTKEEVNKLFELHGAKAGTPTMGGVLMLGAVIFSSLLWARPDNIAVWLLIFTLLYCGGLGFWDDYLKVSKKNSAGVSEKTKLIAQAILALIVAGFFLLNPVIDVQAKSLYVPFYKEPLIANLGIAGAIGFFALVIIGATNAVNLTDGLDGLAAGCTCTAAFAYAILSYVCGHVKIACGIL